MPLCVGVYSGGIQGSWRLVDVLYSFVETCKNGFCFHGVLMQVVKAPPGGPQSPVASNSHSDLDEEFQDALR